MNKRLDKSQKNSQNFDAETSDRSRVQSLQTFDHVLRNTLDTCSDDDDRNLRNFGVVMKNSNNNDGNEINKDSRFYCGKFREIFSDDNEDIEKKIKYLVGEDDVPCDEMIMNENIDFLYEKSSEKSSGNLSFIYTETVESVFGTLVWQSGLMKSLSQLNCVAEGKEFKRCGTMDPRIGVERQDFKENCEDFRGNHKSASMIEVRSVSVIDGIKRENEENQVEDEDEDEDEDGFCEGVIKIENEGRCTMCTLGNCQVF